jgi:hypothetical protein
MIRPPFRQNFMFDVPDASDDLERIADILVVVHHLANLVDEVDDGLGHPVSGRSLSAEDRHTRHNLLPVLGRHCFDLEVAVDDTKDVELLTLVLVDTLDLHVKERFRVDCNTLVLFDVGRESDFVRIFDVTELLAELFVVDVRLNLVQQSEILQELVSTQLRRDQSRELWVGLV